MKSALETFFEQRGEKGDGGKGGREGRRTRAHSSSGPPWVPLLHPSLLDPRTKFLHRESRLQSWYDLPCLELVGGFGRQERRMGVLERRELESVPSLLASILSSSSSMRLRSFSLAKIIPVEIIDLIIQESSISTLHAWSLVSLDCLAIAGPLLVEHIQLDRPEVALRVLVRLVSAYQLQVFLPDTQRQRIYLPLCYLAAHGRSERGTRPRFSPGFFALPQEHQATLLPHPTQSAPPSDHHGYNLLHPSSQKAKSRPQLQLESNRLQRAHEHRRRDPSPRQDAATQDGYWSLL